MKFAFLLWSGVWRWPARTVLVLAQIIVAFVLFGVLNGMNGALKQAIDKQRANVLYVTPRVRGNGSEWFRAHGESPVAGPREAQFCRKRID